MNLKTSCQHVVVAGVYIPFHMPFCSEVEKKPKKTRTFVVEMVGSDVAMSSNDNVDELLLFLIMC